MKRCSHCGKMKGPDAFSLNRQTLDGLAYYCKPCNAEKQREWKHANPTKVKRMKRRYLTEKKRERGE